MLTVMRSGSLAGGLVVAAMLILGSAAHAQYTGQPRPDPGHGRPGTAYHGQGQRPGGIWVKPTDLPRRVREAIDRERGWREVKQIIEYRLDGRTFFRVLIDDRGADRAIIVSESGRLLKAEEVPDLPVGRGSFEKPVRFEDLPDPVRRTFERERANRDIKQIHFVRRDDREFYRIIVDTRGDDLAIRINSVGKILSVEEIDDYAVGSRETSRFDYNRERSMSFEELPIAVRRIVERERDGRPLKQIVFCERNGRAFYRVTIDDRHGDRVLRLAEDGYIYEEREVPDVAIGLGGWDKNRWGHEQRCDYNDLPWRVQTALDRERRGRPVKEITYVRRFSASFYRCMIDARGDDVVVRLSDDGDVLTREQVEDTAIGRPEVEQLQVREEWVKYATLPEAAQRMLDRLRGPREVLKIIRCEARGRVWFRCTIDTHPWPTTVQITEDGRTIGQ